MQKGCRLGRNGGGRRVFPKRQQAAGQDVFFDGGIGVGHGARCKRLIGNRNHLFVLAKCCQRGKLVAVGILVARSERDGGIEVGQRLVRAAKVDQAAPLDFVGVGVSRVKPQRVVGIIGAALPLAELPPGFGPVGPGGDVILGRKGGGVMRERPGAVTLVVADIAKLDPDPGAVGGIAKGLLQGGRGRVILAQHPLRLALVGQRKGGVFGCSGGLEGLVAKCDLGLGVRRPVSAGLRPARSGGGKRGEDEEEPAHGGLWVGTLWASVLYRT